MKVVLRRLGLCHYSPIWERMQRFTRERDAAVADEIWLLQHHPIFTQGSSCHAQPRLAVQDIPVIHTDRGGQITYHGPGQLIAYLLLDLKRRREGTKSLVAGVEQVLIDLLADYGIPAARSRGAPGVYVQHAKIAALGLRISRGCCFHGLSLNVDMDLGPYDFIDPCGYRGLAVTQMCAHAPGVEIGEVEARLAQGLDARFGTTD